MKLKLNPIVDEKNNTNRYCGPSAISAVTGMATGSASKLIREINGRRAIKGAYIYEVTAALDKCNITVTDSCPTTLGVKLPDGSPRKAWVQQPRVTLAQWLKHSKTIRTSGRIFLLVAGNHYQLVSGRKFTCGRVRDIISIRANGVKRRSRVERVFELTAREGGVKIPEVLLQKKQLTNEQKHNAKTRYEAKKLAKEHNIDIELERIDSIDHMRQYYVSMPTEFEDLAHHLDDGLYCDHYCWGFGEVYDKIREQIAFMTENKEHPWLKEYRQRKSST
jgi:hypothetical protein